MTFDELEKVSLLNRLYGISGGNIAVIIDDPYGPKKELLPDIINTAVKRLVSNSVNYSILLKLMSINTTK